MTRIRVGQVFKKDRDENIRLVISMISCSGVTIICNDGSACGEIRKSYILEDWTLIAEYPTWIDAINSPEFKGKGEAGYKPSK